MPTEVATRFRNNLDDVRRTLLAVSPDLDDVPWRPNGWTRKEIVGHLLDSAANNRQRFVRAAIDGVYTGPGYAQDAWVALQGYSNESWDTLLRWWQAEHEMLAAIVDRVSPERLLAPCKIGESEPVTLRFIIEDYVAHQHHYLRQITASRP